MSGRNLLSLEDPDNLLGLERVRVVKLGIFRKKVKKEGLKYKPNFTTALANQATWYAGRPIKFFSFWLKYVAERFTI